MDSREAQCAVFESIPSATIWLNARRNRITSWKMRSRPHTKVLQKLREGTNPVFFLFLMQLDASTLQDERRLFLIMMVVSTPPSFSTFLCSLIMNCVATHETDFCRTLQIMPSLSANFMRKMETTASGY